MFFIGGEETEGRDDDDDDDDNHLSAMSEQASNLDAKPASSTDHIDFFSAREKFLGLSQEGPACCPAEQIQQHSPQDRSPGFTAELPVQEDSETNRDQQAKVIITEDSDTLVYAASV